LDIVVTPGIHLFSQSSIHSFIHSLSNQWQTLLCGRYQRSNGKFEKNGFLFLQNIQFGGEADELKKQLWELGTVAHIHDPSTQEAETGESLVQDQPDYKKKKWL
jgi:hypothetical protein